MLFCFLAFIFDVYSLPRTLWQFLCHWNACSKFYLIIFCPFTLLDQTHPRPLKTRGCIHEAMHRLWLLTGLLCPVFNSPSISSFCAHPPSLSAPTLSSSTSPRHCCADSAPFPSLIPIWASFPLSDASTHACSMMSLYRGPYKGPYKGLYKHGSFCGLQQAG